jgi:transposase
LFPERNIIYQQDSTPCHKAREVLEFFVKNNINLLQWPAYSPDLNCIKNLWAMLKRKLHASDISSKQQLISESIKLWENDEDIRKACLHLIESMPNRLHECIVSKGEYTNY